MNDAPTSSKVTPSGLPPTIAGLKLLTTEQLAELLTDTSVRTLEDWRLDGRGPDFIRLGPKKIRYRISAVERWLDKNERKSAARSA